VLVVIQLENWDFARLVLDDDECVLLNRIQLQLQ
jgi:hypothetical protein